MATRVLSAEEVLESIFYYMNKLVVEKSFSNAVLTLTDLGRVLVNAERASFWYNDVKNKQYWTLAASKSDKIVVEQGRGIIGASIENNETILINEPYMDERFNPQVDKETGYVTKSILCIPVTNSNNEVIGAYQAINKVNEDGVGDFDEQDIKRLALAAGYSGKLLEAHILRKQYQVDTLTGLKNRRGFYECYEAYALSEDNCNVIMCDIDFFKKVNDTYGHNAGDMVLEHVAWTLRRNLLLCKGDVFRWGGEEFIILISGESYEKTVERAERMRKAVMESVCNYNGTQIKVTMSFGVCVLDKKATPEENIKVADERLYEAKATGRNKVVSG